jgi:hypothetical protein
VIGKFHNPAPVMMTCVPSRFISRYKQNKGFMSVPTICFNVNRIHDSVGKTLRAANSGCVTTISQASLDQGITHDENS